MKRPLAYALISSVILAAVLGMLIVLSNSWGWFEVRVMLSTVTIAIGSLCGLACDLSRTPRGSNLLPTGGLVLTLVAAGMILAGMWFDLDDLIYVKSTASIAIFAVATVHICLLSLARLASRFRWVYLLTVQVVVGLAVLLVAIILAEVGEERVFRFVAALSIGAAALSLVIPLLHRISKRDVQQDGLTSVLDERSIASIDEQIAELRQRIAHLEELRAQIAGHHRSTRG